MDTVFTGGPLSLDTVDPLQGQPRGGDSSRFWSFYKYGSDIRNPPLCSHTHKHKLWPEL